MNFSLTVSVTGQFLITVVGLILGRILGLIMGSDDGSAVTEPWWTIASFAQQLKMVSDAVVYVVVVFNATWTGNNEIQQVGWSVGDASRLQVEGFHLHACLIHRAVSHFNVIKLIFSCECTNSWPLALHQYVLLMSLLGHVSVRWCYCELNEATTEKVVLIGGPLHGIFGNVAVRQIYAIRPGLHLTGI